jgi:hypothetical protein
VLVVIDAGADCGVVVVPLLPSDAPVVVDIPEVLQELEENLLLGHGAAPDLGVHGSIVYSFQVQCRYLAVAVLVELKVGLVDDDLSPHVRSAPHCLQELVVVDRAVPVLVQVFHQTHRLLFREVASEVPHCDEKLRRVDHSRVPLHLHDAEGPADAADLLVAPGVKLVPHFVEQSLDVHPI